MKDSILLLSSYIDVDNDTSHDISNDVFNNLSTDLPQNSGLTAFRIVSRSFRCVKKKKKKKEKKRRCHAWRTEEVISYPLSYCLPERQEGAKDQEASARVVHVARQD